MQLLPPCVVGPISELSPLIKVEGQIIGADVYVAVDGDFENPIAKGSAKYSSQEFFLKSGVVLTAGSKITAIQNKDGITSEPSPDPIIVQAIPDPLPVPVICSNLYAYPFVVGIDKLVPGTTANLLKANSAMSPEINNTGCIGISIIGDGIASSIMPNETVFAFQSISMGAHSKSVESLPAEVPGMDPLPSPIINSPVECDRALLLSNVLDGARITVHREYNGNHSEFYSCYWGESWYVTFDEPLRRDEILKIKQEFNKSPLPDEVNMVLSSLWSEGVRVRGAESVSPPIVWGPICFGATSVLVSNCRPGAILTVNILMKNNDIIELGTWQAPPSGWCNVPLSKFPEGNNRQLFVTQSICKQTSDSNKIYIDDYPKEMDTPEIPGPLYACAGIVRVNKIVPGAKVTIYSEMLQAPIAQLRVYNDFADIKVCPNLIAKDSIWVEQSGCSDKKAKASDHVTVEVFDTELPEPEVEKVIHPFTNPIRVTNVVPGAQVHLWIDGHWLAKADATESSIDVYIPSMFILPAGLPTEKRIAARQLLCTRISEIKSNGVLVTTGNMKVHVNVLTGQGYYLYGNLCEFIITITDADDESSVDGDVYVDGVMVAKTNQSFKYKFDPNVGLPIGIVKANGYNDASIDWPRPLRLMEIKVSPTSVKKGDHCSIFVEAHDLWDSTKQVIGPVRIDGYVKGKTFSSILYSWPVTFPAAKSLIAVEADDGSYQVADFYIQLVDPEVSPSKTGMLYLVLSDTAILNSTTVAINIGTAWLVEGTNFSMQGSGMKAEIAIPVPQGSTITIYCNLAFDVLGNLITPNGTIPGPIGVSLQGGWNIVWTGISKILNVQIRYIQESISFELIGTEQIV